MSFFAREVRTTGSAGGGASTVRVTNSTASELLVQVEPGVNPIAVSPASTLATNPFSVRIVNSSGDGFATSSQAVNSTYIAVNSGASSAFNALISSAASTVYSVFAFSVTSTVVAPTLVEFMSGTNATLWGVLIGSGSSGITGANLAVTPPAALFKTAAGAGLNLRVGTTGVVFHTSISWFTE